MLWRLMIVPGVVLSELGTGRGRYFGTRPGRSASRRRQEIGGIAADDRRTAAREISWLVSAHTPTLTMILVVPLSEHPKAAMQR